ncbi:hypothetical protein [Legionella saoudiensis]|uniref:hypothetical protein n=1 Tax=Legionella saoudiensis TaxID=1750561 RepID=UPI000731E2BD|nr:hypothetical protein [Legionella saoudiensis]
MFMRLIILSLTYLFASPLWAITCYYTLAKDNCWLKYDVTVEVMDAVSAKVLTSITVPAGQAWGRVTFPCETNGQKLMYRARYSPIFWESEKGKVYSAKNYWSLPNEIKSGDSAWNVSVCYPTDFAAVPLPPEATNNCQCDFSTIPAIPPKQL